MRIQLPDGIWKYDPAKGLWACPDYPPGVSRTMDDFQRIWADMNWTGE